MIRSNSAAAANGSGCGRPPFLPACSRFAGSASCALKPTPRRRLPADRSGSGGGGRAPAAGALRNRARTSGAAFCRGAFRGFRRGKTAPYAARFHAGPAARILAIWQLLVARGRTDPREGPQRPARRARAGSPQRPDLPPPPWRQRACPPAAPPSYGAIGGGGGFAAVLPLTVGGRVSLSPPLPIETAQPPVFSRHALSTSRTFLRSCACFAGLARRLPHPGLTRNLHPSALADGGCRARACPAANRTTKAA